MAEGGIPGSNYTFDSWYFYYDYDKPTFKIETQTFNLYVNEPFRSLLEKFKTDIASWIKKNSENLTIIKYDEDDVFIVSPNTENSKYSIELNFKDFNFNYTDYESGFNYTTKEPIDILFILKEYQNLDFIGG